MGCEAESVPDNCLAAGVRAPDNCLPISGLGVAEFTEIRAIGGGPPGVCTTDAGCCGGPWPTFAGKLDGCLRSSHDGRLGCKASTGSCGCFCCWEGEVLPTGTGVLRHDSCGLGTGDGLGLGIGDLLGLAVADEDCRCISGTYNMNPQKRTEPGQRPWQIAQGGPF
mmetsp:Transcript_147811/g.257723  ORF Transcript_147811/g.257723 Transcript_147811/m.257723 type:complete len:166 (-) Transcript_147811:33-530(-)